MAATLRIDEVVRFVGLSADPTLNGTIGTVFGDDDNESAGKYSVHLRNALMSLSESHQNERMCSI
jgi:hypothetical protein